MARKQPRYINRELSWLEFNQRVLEEAEDKSVPVLERLKFLAITSSNLDEFFMVRVGGLRLLVSEGVTSRDASGLTPGQQLELITRRTHRMVEEQYAAYDDGIEPELADKGVRRIHPEKLTDAQTRYIEQLFEQEIGVVLTPAAVESPTRFPLVRNLGLQIAVRLRPEPGARKPRFAVIPVGAVLGRFITLPAGEAGYRYILVEDVVKLFVQRLFPGEPVAECVPFRITRNAGMSVDEDGAADLLAQMEKVLDARKQGDCVRLEIETGATQMLLAFLQKALNIAEQQTYHIPGPLDLSAFMKLAGMDGFEDLKYEPWTPQAPPAVDPTASIFAVLAQRDVLLCHPYESFEPVLRLIEEASQDPDVLAIKQILYRTSRNSPVIDALRRAAGRGKYVTVIVELKARFDEARNIGWAKKLEQEGVQVIYGVKSLKTHAKVCVVVRREARGIVRYLHFGTGNYNEATARLYSDVSYMTCDEDLGTDASAFFNAITGYSTPQSFLKLAIAPMGLREKVLELIESETERSRQGQKALIMAKVNSLVDRTLIDALYTASQAGVEVLLNVRGICCLRPGIKGLSDNIMVISIVDRFLEHSRIFHFSHGGEDRVYISSADWMPRNLDRRVELLVPVDDDLSRRTLISILRTYFQDTTKSRRLLPDGRYERPKGRRKRFRSQEALFQRACDEVAQAQQARRTVFEPHRPPMQQTEVP